MITAIVVIFIVAYAAVAFEHPLRVNKSATALVGSGLRWTLYALSASDTTWSSENLNESVAATAQIVFFLIGAMTIVEVVDAHNGFEVITSPIKTSQALHPDLDGGFRHVFPSAVLDNLTTTIVMISLMRKLVDRQEDRLFFAGIIVIAANAGGAWSPIGDVTTTMLWIGGQISSIAIIKGVFLAALVNLLVPLAIASYCSGGGRSSRPGSRKRPSVPLDTPSKGT